MKTLFIFRVVAGDIKYLTPQTMKIAMGKIWPTISLRDLFLQRVPDHEKKQLIYIWLYLGW